MIVTIMAASTETRTPGGGGALGFERVPTAKRPRGVEVVNAKI